MNCLFQEVSWGPPGLSALHTRRCQGSAHDGLNDGSHPETLEPKVTPEGAIVIAALYRSMERAVSSKDYCAEVVGSPKLLEAG